MTEFMDFAQKMAREAGKLLASKLTEQHQVHYKGTIDLVTEADKMSEELILTEISRLYPDHGILSEESAVKNEQAKMRWIIDPLDGTTNYAHGFPFFCVSIALEKEGAVVLGVIYDPVRDELFAASRACGAYLNGKKLRVSIVNDLSRSLLATGFPYDIRVSPDNNLNFFSAMAVKAQAIRRPGAAALDLAYLACGRIDGFWELKLKPWDTAAGSLLVTEAGGTISDMRGGPWRLKSPDLLASNGLIQEQMMEVFKEAEG
ncbi:MAG: inositol monophosphatase [Deltaproteobacteria bacterium HGW-Deltaproteobacteria-6]|nr:MAG: inositol monophosphatase [Deltaproteobacteria bacterium HGW-Deltaproteobacteria-6]